MNQLAQPGIAPLFNHPYSVGHALLGAGAAFLPEWAAWLLSIGFMMYEFGRVKTTDQRLGNLGEFAIGFAAARVAVTA